ncbi:response regulator [Haloarculaceae archaeon H-GB11]|nr:response regulator [Haloarculaceae archaeon H-GB11]
MNGTLNDSESDLSSDELFGVFSEASRRTILFHLRQHGSATVDELVDVLAMVEEFDAGRADRDRIASSLVHVALPRLEAQGLVSYDPDEGIVQAVDADPRVDEWLDLAVRHEIQLDAQHAPARERPDGEQDEIHVLLVDDEPGLVETISRYVERETDDLVVHTTTSVLEAVSTLEEGDFDCIVSDYQMPAISGLDFLKAVREEDDTVPFIVFTAKGSESTASEAITSGVTDYVPKQPGTELYDVLIGRIRRAVE